jgi:serine/threonine protein kinase
MEFADLGSLVHLIEHSPLDEAVLSSLVLQLLHGLDYIQLITI